MPAYLQVEYGRDIVVGRIIARGGMGCIKLAKAMSPELIERTAGMAIVAKIFDAPL